MNSVAYKFDLTFKMKRINMHVLYVMSHKKILELFLPEC